MGSGLTGFGRDLGTFANMLGAIGVAAMRVLARPRDFRFTSAVNQLDRVGWQAVPIILLITFLIGAIIAQQGIFHFRKFGAEMYVVDMVGILVLREIGVLIVAIMVAGRSGSSYTAELGSMKMREEIDALAHHGLRSRRGADPAARPRADHRPADADLPRLDGGALRRRPGRLALWRHEPGDLSSRGSNEAISLTHFKVGMIKAPFMALVIGVVACAEGLRVKGSAESLGLQTTTSVVKSIFLVIVLDGLFAIFFASIGM